VARGAHLIAVATTMVSPRISDTPSPQAPRQQAGCRKTGWIACASTVPLSELTSSSKGMVGKRALRPHRHDAEAGLSWDRLDRERAAGGLSGFGDHSMFRRSLTRFLGTAPAGTFQVSLRPSRPP